MDALEGLLTINGVDVYARYGAFLAEDKAGDNKNYSALLKPPAVKTHAAVDFRELDGEKLPERLSVAWQPREVTLQFALTAPDRAEFIRRYEAFVGFLKAGDGGWLRITLPELGRTYRMYYRESTDYRQLTDFGGEVAARFNVKLREPVPTPVG